MKCNSCGAELENAKFCPECGAAAPKPAPCGKCGFEHDKKYCPECGTPAPVSSRCANCGTVHSAKFCPECGVPAKAGNTGAPPPAAPQQPVAPPQTAVPMQQPQIIINNQNTNTNTNANFNPGIIHAQKSKLVTLILCLLGGVFGAHNFYVDKTGMGILYFFTAGLFGFGIIIDVIRILTGSFRDKWGVPLV